MGRSTYGQQSNPADGFPAGALTRAPGDPGGDTTASRTSR